MMSGPEADAGEGGAGAPPPTTESNKVPAGTTRTYEREGIRVYWLASRCIHSAACIRALPQVFDPQRRPWVDVSGGNADDIARAVEECPTGALKYERTDGGPGEVGRHEVEIVPVRHGPYFVRGPVTIVDPGSREPARETRVALCRCGRSKHMPLCDNTHRATGFRTD